MTKVPNTKTEEEIKEFITSMKDVPRTGLHNPFLNTERYLMLGEVNRKVVEAF
jgi:1-pyrroline-5-carboxylate dehydrogenase